MTTGMRPIQIVSVAEHGFGPCYSLSGFPCVSSPHRLPLYLSFYTMIVDNMTEKNMFNTLG